MKFTVRILLFPASLNASVTVIWHRSRISFDICRSFFFLLLPAFTWKFLTFAVEKNLRALTGGQKAVRVEVGRGRCHSHLRSRENHAKSPPAHQRATASALSRARPPPALQGSTLQAIGNCSSWRVFRWAWGVLWATGCDSIHSQYKWLYPGDFGCSPWVVTHFFSLRSGTSGKTTGPFLLRTL